MSFDQNFVTYFLVQTILFQAFSELTSEVFATMAFRKSNTDVSNEMVLREEELT